VSVASAFALDRSGDLPRALGNEKNNRSTHLRRKSRSNEVTHKNAHAIKTLFIIIAWIVIIAQIFTYTFLD
jgi:preprotein translocase subunit Sec63